MAVESSFLDQITRHPVEKTVPFNGIDFKTTFWPVPEGKTVNGRILFVHGFSEYFKAYLKPFEDLSEAGYEIFFFDQRGAGYTSQGSAKGVTNEFHTFNDLDYFIEQNLKELEESDDHVNKKLFLGGHSMGGGIVLNYGVTGKYKDQVRGIFTTGPLIGLHPETKPHWLLFKFLRVVLKVAPNFKFNTALNIDYITSDEKAKQFLLNDPFLSPVGTLRQLNEFVFRGEKLLDPNYNKDLNRPVLIVHGKKDMINDPEASKKFIEQIPIEEKTITLIGDARHSLLLEREELYTQAISTILEWLAKY